jgi:hypothetical protein
MWRHILALTSLKDGIPWSHLEGTDHASLEPMGLRKLSRDLVQALSFKTTDILPIE